MAVWTGTLEALATLMKTTPDFWRRKRVLVTGHSGFKGAWLTIWLHRLGAQVIGISLPPNTEPNLASLVKIDQLCESHFCDIRDPEALTRIIHSAQPEIVFHLAAQPLVRASYREPVETFATNVMGTAHVLEALRGLESVKAAVMITTDKVYQNHEWPWPYREVDALGGHDPYSASKAASEMVIASYRDAFLRQQGVAVASVRAGNVIGGGDWSEDRLIPDAIRAWQANQTLEIRRPNAIRPWQHVLEPLAGYLMLAEQICSDSSKADAYNFGPNTHEVATVRQVVELAREANGGGAVRYGGGTEGPHEATWLALDIAKARTTLGYHPRWFLQESVQHAVAWYKSQQYGDDAFSLCSEQIELFEGTCGK